MLTAKSVKISRIFELSLALDWTNFISCSSAYLCQEKEKQVGIVTVECTHLTVM